MKAEQLITLNKKIKTKASHNRRLYELSPTLRIRKQQVSEMVNEMDDSVQAMRTEQLLVKKSITELPNYYYIKSNLDKKKEERVR